MRHGLLLFSLHLRFTFFVFLFLCFPLTFTFQQSHASAATHSSHHTFLHLNHDHPMSECICSTVFSLHVFVKAFWGWFPEVNSLWNKNSSDHCLHRTSAEVPTRFVCQQGMSFPTWNCLQIYDPNSQSRVMMVNLSFLYIITERGL
jgi:hypothetical protein